MRRYHQGVGGIHEVGHGSGVHEAGHNGGILEVVLTKNNTKNEIIIHCTLHNAGL